MTAEEILDLVAALDVTIGPETRFRWKREVYWHPDDDAQDALNQLRRAWRIYHGDHLHTWGGQSSVPLHLMPFERRPGATLEEMAMTAEDILDLVAALDATIDPDTFLRWKRELFWYPDDEAQDTLDQLRRAWRLYLRTLAGPNSVR